MIRTISIASLLMIAGCGQPSEPAPHAKEKVAAAPIAPVTKAEVPSLEGKWRVATPALDLTIDGGQATLASGCLRRGFTFRQDRNAVAFASSPAGSSNCGRTPSAAEETAFAALADANLAVFGKDGRDVTLSGLGGMLTLERR